MQRALPAGLAVVAWCAGLAAGCHGERAPLGPSQLPPHLLASRFVAFGDSVTAGEVTAPQSAPFTSGLLPVAGPLTVVPEAAYPTVLGRRLAARYPAQAIVVQNAGRPGESAARAVTRFAATIDDARPEAVLLLDGYNDLDSIASITAAATAMSQMVDAAQAQGIRVFVATLTPGIPGRQRSPSETLVSAYNTLLRAVASSHDVPLVDLFELAAANPGAWIGIDGLHPTEQGYTLIAEAFFAAIQARLETR